MESGPVMNPPSLLERFAGALLPPDSREHVLGDLCERHRSPGRLLFEVLRVLPFLLATRIRRTSFLPAWPLLALVLTGVISPGAELSMRGFIPAVVLLVAYMFRDAYRQHAPLGRLGQGLVDAAVVCGAIAVSQLILSAAAPGWMMTPAGVFGLGVAIVVLTWLRFSFPDPRRAAPSRQSS